MKIKSNIKSKKFYKEAEDMQEGWGEYLKYIDILKDKVYNTQEDISLDDACWVLYGEGHCFYVWEGFQKYAKNKGWNEKKMPWEAWEGLFIKYCKIPL